MHALTWTGVRSQALLSESLGEAMVSEGQDAGWPSTVEVLALHSGRYIAGADYEVAEVFAGLALSAEVLDDGRERRHDLVVAQVFAIELV